MHGIAWLPRRPRTTAPPGSTPDTAGPRDPAPSVATEVVVSLHQSGLGDAPDVLPRRLHALLAPGPTTLVIDASGVDDLSSATMAVLLWTRRRCAVRQVRVVLRAPSRRSVGLLRRSGLQDTLEIESAPPAPHRTGSRGRP